MKLLVLGGTGLVGSAFVKLLKTEGIDYLSPTSAELSILDKHQIENYLLTHGDISCIVNFSAYTDVSSSEDDRNNLFGPTWNLNVNSIKNLIHIVQPSATRLVQISTDMVFSGKKDNPGPYSEDSPVNYNPNLLSWYGWSKASAERLISDSLSNFAIVRISNPVRFGYTKKLDYIQKILHSVRKERNATFFSDQFLTLSFIDEVCQSLRKIIRFNHAGVYHVSSNNIFTPYEISKYIATKLNIQKQISPSSIVDFFLDHPSLMNRYMQFSGLLTEQTQKNLDLHFSSWQEIVDTLIRQGLE